MAILRNPFFLQLAVTTTLFVTLFATQPLHAQPKIVYRLKWLINMSTVGDVVAEYQGLFKAQGLAVTLKPGGPERDAIRELELGYAEFGVASADQVIQAAAKGAPVVVIAQLFQINPLEWIYFKDKFRFNGLDSLKGKTIGVTFGKNDEFIMRTLLSEAAIPDDQIKLFSVRLDYTPFFKRQVDLWPVYANTQAIEIGQKLKLAGQDFGILRPQDYNVHFVANSLVTSRRMVVERPSEVQRFKEAVIKGWQAAIDPRNVELAIKAVQQYDKDTTSDTLVEQLAATRQLIQPQGDKAVGSIDIGAWEQTEKIMLANKQIHQPVNVVRYLLIQ